MRMFWMAMVGMILVMGTSVGLSGEQSVQTVPQPGYQTPGMPGSRHNPMDSDPINDPHREEQQEKARSTDRQKRLVADTDKLLALATDLKQQVDKTNQNIMSVDVIKKADEIEKLARSVKERMKG